VWKSFSLSTTPPPYVSAKDGHQAVRKARNLHPKLIVMDLQMPKLDGWGAIKELQRDANTAAIPIIVLTGHDFKTHLKPAALAIGACSFLMKPCFPDQLAREIGIRLALSHDQPARAI
jgi:CheY-like chemotaxis protein